MGGFCTLVSFITAVCGLYTQIPVLQRMKLKCLAIRVMTAASIYIPSEERTCMFSRTCMLRMSTGLIFATNSASVSMVQDITPDNCQ